MKTIKILQAVNPDVDKGAVTKRLTAHLIKLRKASLALEFIGNDEHSAELGQNDFDEVADELSENIELTWDDDRRIGKRVQLFMDRKKEASGLGHLRDKEIQRLRPLIAGVRMAEPESEHWVDEVVSTLHEEMPWMASATKEVWFALRHNAKAGDPIRLPPLLLNGPPGIGKSVCVRRQGRVA